MAGSRRKHSREFKIEAVRRVVEDGIPQTHVAEELGVSANTLSAWKRQFEKDSEHAFPGHGKQKPDDAEMTKFRREVARLKREVEILKKPPRTSRKSRSEVLNAYLFESLDQVRTITGRWVREYNEQRPHDALGKVPPSVFRRATEAKNYTLELST